MYTYNNIVYITNERTGEEVTSYAVPIQLDSISISTKMKNEFDESLLLVQNDKSKWKSNTVIVVDTSGSMKSSDVWDTKTRLDAVWQSVALDFIANRIENGEAGLLDVISIISLGTSSEILIKEHPTSWVLYNKIVHIYQTKCVAPRGHGNYIPSLDVAEELLTANSNSSCAMGLCFISDGKPSDHVHLSLHKNDIPSLVCDRVATLAKKFGRRLQFDAVGIGSSENFDALQDMVETAKDYGANANFLLPSMSSSSLGNMLQSFATSITSTQTEMTDLNTNKQQIVRNVNRESRKVAAKKVDFVAPDKFYIYAKNRVKRFTYKEWWEERKLCHEFELSQLQNKNAAYVGMNREIFGEGGERFAYRFYEVAEDGATVVGKALVAKESRYVVENSLDDERSRRKFVETFCKTQQLARRIAEEFNEKIKTLNRVDDSTPGVSFLDCSVYRLDDDNLGELSVLVEERLDESKWHKWNANNGYVDGMEHAPKFNEEEMRSAMSKLKDADLGIIEEGDEEEEEDEESVKSVENNKAPIVFTPSEVAQAFSHFSYWATGRKRLICDLQGNYDEESNMLRLSDPVIHYCNYKNSNKVCVHGRTDRGKKVCF